MLDNNLLFSLVLSVINTIAFLLIKSNDENEVKTQDLIMLGSVTFISSFLLKSFLNRDLMKGGGEILTHSTRAPF
jgi:hypothetical protein|tara:strand:- start:2820 stop:3044 length:225 start_codon:yes stop_codon:yes gene_type:complete